MNSMARLAYLISLLTMFFVSCDKLRTVDTATKNDIFIMGIGTEPKTLDPQHATAISEALVLQGLFEGLCSSDPRDDTIARPGVARTWNSNDAATEWTFTLRHSAQWSDKIPITACDFIFSFHRILHPASGSKYADMLYVLKNAEPYNKDHRGYILCGLERKFPTPWETIAAENWQGKPLLSAPDSLSEEGKRLWQKGLNTLTTEELSLIKSAPEHHFSWLPTTPPPIQQAILDALLNHTRAGCPDLWEKAEIGVSSPNEYKLHLSLRGPTPYLPLLTKHFTWMPVPAHILNKNNDLGLSNTAWTQPGKMISNGPFTLKSWRINDSIEIIKNPHYRRAENIKLKGMKFLPIVNGFTETRMYFDGKLHATNNIPAEMMPYAKKRGGKDFQLTPYYATTLYRFNTLRKPLDDKRVRQALAYSLNQQALVDKVLQGAGTPATGFCPPTSAYSPPNLIHYNPEHARKLLAEAGYPGGKNFPKLTVLTTSREVQKTMTEAIQAQWKQVLGINVEIKSSEWASYKMAQQQGDYDIAYGSWSGDYPDPSTFLELWTGTNGNNNTGWQDPEFEQYIHESRQLKDPALRNAQFTKAETILLEECPILPLFWSKRAYLLHPDVRGWHPILMDARPYSTLNLIPAKKKNRAPSLSNNS